MQKWMLFLAAATLAAPAPAASVQQTTVTLQAGFSPDPHRVSVRAGGPVPAADLDNIPDECDYGYFAVAGWTNVNYTSEIGEGLYFWAEAEDDGDIMLLMSTPSGRVLCDDDSHEGLNPLIHLTSTADGVYEVVIGSYSQDTFHDATLFVSRSQPDGAAGSTSTASTGSPDLSLEPGSGRVSLSAPFSPDPHSVPIAAGGSVDVDVGGCSYGYVARAPDYNLTYSGSGSTLYIFARSDEDTTLLINRPDATWVCDDDSLGDSNPVVTIPNAPSGLYNIWVGTYGTSITSSTLYISTTGAK